MSQPQADQESLIDALVAGGVEFIVVGGIAAVLHSAPSSTRDLDIVHARDAENVERLMAVLDQLDARVRDRGRPSPGPARRSIADGDP